MTLEVQSVLVTLVDESTLDVRCLFISGSDAVGCYVVLISDPTKAESENVTVTLMRKPHDLYASGQINLTHKVHCNVRVFVFNIDVNNVTSNFSIERELAPNANFTCSGIYYVLCSMEAIHIKGKTITLYAILYYC